MIFKSLRSRLVVWFICIESITLIIFGLVLYELQSANLYAHHDELLISSQKSIIKVLEPYAQTNFASLPEGLSDLKESIEIRTAQNLPIFSTPTFKKLSSNISVRKGSDEEFISFETDRGEAVRVLLSPISNGHFYLLQASWLGNIKHTLHDLALNLFLLVPLLLTATSFGAYLIVTKALKPVVEITRKTKEIRAKNLDQLLDVKTSDEGLQNLVSTMNGMLERLNSTFRSIRQFTADASHELKTPLTAIAGTLEVAASRTRTQKEYHEAIQTALDQIARLNSIVNDLLLLSSLDTHNALIKREEINAATLVSNVSEMMQPLFAEKRIEARLSVLSQPKIIGDENQLYQVLVNLLDNALHHTSSGGTVQLMLDQKNHTASFTVLDSGRGIPKEHLSKIFDRFFRIDRSQEAERKGSGLGLAIVKRIVEAHGGNISVESNEGEGSRFVVTLPSTN